MLPQRTTQDRLDQDRSASQLLKQGVIAFRAGDKEHARELIAEAAELDPNSELVWMWSASTARNRNEALAALGHALEINPDNVKAKQWIERLSPAKKPAAAAPSTSAVKNAPAPQNKPTPEAQMAKAAAATAPLVAADPQSQPPQVEQGKRAPVLAPAPVKPPVAEQDDPIRDLLRSKLGLPEDKPAAQEPAAEHSVAEGTNIGEAAPTETPKAEQTETKQEVAPDEQEQQVEPEQAAAEEPAASARPISQQTCLLCSKHSLHEGVCGFCRAIGDLRLLDEISRNESVDRTTMLAAVERFRKELEAGPSFEANLGLALAYLNLKQSNDALPRLAEACRLQPGNSQLRLQYEQLRARRLILVVDDSKTVQKMIAGVLEKALYRVMLAEDGLQALARLDDETPSLILLDITMPRMDGYQVAKIITGNDATASIPVVMLSGKDGFFDRIRGRMVGAKDYVTKPFDPDELIGTIRRCMDS